MAWRRALQERAGRRLVGRRVGRPVGRRVGRWRTEALLVLVVLLLAAPPLQEYKAQQSSRLALTAALWDHHTVEIDGYVLFNDYAVKDGRVLSDKAPGQPLWALPAYGLYRAAGGHPAEQARAEGDLGVWVVSLWSATLPAAALVVLLFRAAERVRPGSGVPVSLALAGGTMLLPFSTLLLGHVLAAALGFGAFVTVWLARRPDSEAGLSAGAAATGGLLAGGAVAVEYPCVILAGAAAAVVLVRAPAAIGWFLLGLAPPALVTAAYHVAAFGGPFEVPYRYHATYGQVHRTGLFGIDVPRPGQMLQVLLGERGLLVLSPVVAVALVGLVVLARRPSDPRPPTPRPSTRRPPTPRPSDLRPVAVIALAAVVAFVVIPSGLVNLSTDYAPGPRSVTPVLPFLALGLAVAWERWPKITTAAAMAGVAVMVAATFSQPLLSPQRDELRYWFTHLFARPVVGGLPGGSLLPTLLAGLTALALLRGRPRRTGPIEPAGATSGGRAEPVLTRTTP